VSTKDIAEALAMQNINVDRKLIKLDDPFKAVGSYEVPVRFSGRPRSTSASTSSACEPVIEGRAARREAGGLLHWFSGFRSRSTRRR
jgi:hypothetical protein